MFKQILVTSIAVISLALAGCASSGKKNTPPPPPPATSGMTNYGAPDNSVTGSGLGNGSVDLSNKKSVYFALDSSDLNAEGQGIVSSWAKYLASNPSVRVRLEGNTDERGTREYNVALGERRGDAVKAALMASGASASQLSVVSYGEERPVADGHDETAWAQNRRVDIIQQ